MAGSLPTPANRAAVQRCWAELVPGSSQLAAGGRAGMRACVRNFAKAGVDSRETLLRLGDRPSDASAVRVSLAACELAR